MIDENRKDTHDSENETKGLVDWKNPPTVNKLKEDFTEAKNVQSAQVTKIKGWLDNLNMENGAKPKTAKNNSKVAPKLIRKQAEWRYPALSEPFLTTYDLFNVKPKTWEDRKSAKQNELLLNYQMHTSIDKVSFIDEYVRTAVDEGTVIIRTGWDFREETVKEIVPKVKFIESEGAAELHEQLAQMKEESPSQYLTDVPEELRQAHDLTIELGKPILPEITGYEEKDVTKTVCNKPTVEICDYQNVFIDPTCGGDMDKAAFVIHSFETSKSELEKDGKYHNLDKLSVEDNAVLAVPDHSPDLQAGSFSFKDEPRKKIVVYEYWGYWDIDGNGLVKPIVAAWVGNTLIRLEENPYPDKKIPFTVVQYLPVRRSIYGEPDGALLEENQKILGAVTRGMVDLLAKSANGQTGIRKDMMDLTNRKKYDAGLDYEFNPTVDPRQGVYMHTFPEIPASAQYLVQLMNMEAESLTGVKSFSDGVTSSSLGDVAAGIRGALDAASKRETAILRRLSEGIIKVGRKILSMNAEFLSEEEVIRLTNEKFEVIRRDDLPGYFDLELSISTAEEDNAKAQELAFMLQTTGPNMDPELSKMILSDIARLRKMPDMAKKIEAYQPKPDPMAQKMAELQIALLEAQIAKENAQAMSYQANAQLDVAKAGSEQVKAGNLQSDTDQKNLDFIEQESGVKHAREIEKQGAQAEAQGRLKLIDAQMQREKNNNDLLKEYVKARTKVANK